MADTIKLSGEQRQSLIISTGVFIANRDGLTCTNANTIASECRIKTSVATVRFYFRRNADLWRAIATHSDASKVVRDEALALGVL